MRIPGTATVANQREVPRKPLDQDAAAFSTKTRTTKHIASTRGAGWALEYLALALTTITITVLIVLLACIDHLPLTHWSAPLSPTTTISILAAIARASIGFAISSCLGQAKWNWLRKRSDKLLAFDRFDEASRGPWGSLWLIIWVKACHMAAIGAVVTIILLVFEPSFQAIVSFNGGNIDSLEGTLKASLGSSKFLDLGTYYSFESTDMEFPLPNDNSVPLSGFISQPDLGLVSAANSGFYNLTETKKQTASFVCSTANCTWSPFTSLAVCSSCNDVTSSLKRDRKEGQNLGTLQRHDQVSFTNWTIISLPDVNLTNASDEGGNYGGAFMSATIQGNHERTISFKKLDTMITAVQMLKAADGYIYQNLTWNDTPVTATECALYFCTNAYRARVIQGQLEEEIVASWAERDPASYSFSTIGKNITDLNLFDEISNHSLYADFDESRYDLRLFIRPGDLGRSGLPSNVTTSFNLSQVAVGSTVHFMNDDFFSSLMVWPIQGDVALGKSTPVIQALYYSRNLSETFENAAQSITNWIRDTSNFTQAGATQEWTIKIQIEWPYITAPLTAFLAGVVFCVYTILETRKLRLDPWKTGTIATLTHSVDAETRAQLRHAHRHGYLDKAAKAMVVKFEDAGSGLELKIKKD
ncbi:hypothetical protein F4808DRAFT_453984 [Astrocystis sublimbata]|nr:hypothetical protein F4808DRAFT_453984 [Astrocystis sublimbata]